MPSWVIAHGYQPHRFSLQEVGQLRNLPKHKDEMFVEDNVLTTYGTDIDTIELVTENLSKENYRSFILEILGY